MTSSSTRADIPLAGSVAFIGGGNMAAALAAGLVQGMLQPTQLHIVDPDPATREAWSARGASVAAAPDARLAQCDIWVYAVKPQVMHAVVEQTRPWLRQPLVISIAAGVTAAALARWLVAPGQSPYTRLVRTMPNTPALVGQGVTGLAASAQVEAADRALAERLLRSVGEVVWVDDESALDAVTALSGSGPAYVFLFLQALIEGGQKLGLSAEQARGLALGTLKGATVLAEQSSESPDVLRERVTSKGGTTAAALAVFAERDWADAVGEAMVAAAQRARELGRELA